MLAVDPSSKRSGGSLLGDRARIEHDPRDDGILIRSTAAGTRLGGLAAAHARGGAGARRRVRRRGRRDRRRRPVGDRRRGAVRHGRRGRPARLGRHAPVPEGGDHGGARRARGDEGRPRADRPARAPRPGRRAARARLARHAGGGRVVGAAAERDRRARRRARRAPRRGSTSPARASAPAGWRRWPSSRSSTARARCARCGGRREAEKLLAEQDPGLPVSELVKRLEA